MYMAILQVVQLLYTYGAYSSICLETDLRDLFNNAVNVLHSP